MKLLIIAVLSLSITKQALGQDDINQDYLIQLQFNISESRIPNYLVGVIYNRPVEKNVSTEAVLNLYQTSTINLTTTENILPLLNISNGQVFSINNFNYTMTLFNWTFTNFYNSITTRLNLSGQPLRNGLTALGINVNDFSAGIAFGVPDPWQEFIQGNFTRANLELACTEVNITLEMLWVGVRDIFLTNLLPLQIQNFVQLLLNHNIAQQHALIIWNAIPVTVQHVYNQVFFNNMLGNFITRMNNQTALGVVTTQQQLVVHRSIHEAFRQDRELLDISAQTLSSRTSLTIGSINDTTFRNLVILQHSNATTINNLTVINIGYQNSNRTNCTYVTFQNNNILNVNVPTARFFNETYELPRSVIENVVLGSALVCNNTVLGLARGVVGDVIIADAFSNLVVPLSSAYSISMGKIFINTLSGIVLILIVNVWCF